MKHDIELWLPAGKVGSNQEVNMIITGDKMARFIRWLGIVFLPVYMLAFVLKVIPKVDVIVPLLILTTSSLTFASSKSGKRQGKLKK